MLIDTTKLMYAVFQSCRHALRHAGTSLDLLSNVMGIVKQDQILIVEVPDQWFNAANIANEYLQHLKPDTVPNLNQELESKFRITPAKQKLFTLLFVGVHELQRLWTAESKLAVRSLGYAFHNMPRFLQNPSEFERSYYIFSFRIVSPHWNDLSLEMRQILCEVMEIDMDDATQLSASDEFNIEM